MNFVALDWETANGARGSACAVGLVRVRGGQVRDRWSSLIRPPDHFSGMDPRNTAVHGLAEEDVAAAPPFRELWPRVEARLLGDLVVAHNAQFDLGVIQDATWASGHRCPHLRYGCTLLLARRHYLLDSYTLDEVAAAADVRLEHHHDALSDALAAAQVLLRIAADLGTATVEETFAAHGLALGWSAGPDAAPCRVVGRSRWERVVPGTGQAAEPTLF